MNLKRCIAVLSVLPLCGLLAFTDVQAIDRRKDQFTNVESHLVVPLPYSLPGIGKGFFIPFYWANISGSYVDMFGVGLVGDAEGVIAGIEDVHLISRTLIVDTFYQYIDSLLYTIYSGRGMKTDPDDYSNISLTKVLSTGYTARLSFFDRRLEMFHAASQQTVEADRLLDPKGNLIADFNPKYKESGYWSVDGFQLDYTDDYASPIKGVRFSMGYSDFPSDNPDNPNFYVVDAYLNFYIPVGNYSSLVLANFRSDAFVRRKGLTDLATIKANDGIDCLGDPVCLALEDAQARNVQAANSNGTATDLGGENRLRGYPNGRFKGAHSAVFSLELRLNFAEEFTPFDFFIWKDVRTGVQFAVFYDVGTVSEKERDLWKDTSSVYGFGMRMIGGSGLVYRAELAITEEGSAPLITVGYPF